MDLFVYGSLCFYSILASLVQNPGTSFRGKVQGYSARRVKGQGYPAAVPDPSAILQGLVWTGLQEQDLAILDAFEGSDYKRVRVPLIIDGGQSKFVELYQWVGSDLDLETTPWKVHHFLESQAQEPMNLPEGTPRSWLMKSEPHEVSIDDLGSSPQQTVPWTGVRNYLARNYMRDQMRVGDLVFFYHSSCPKPGIAGLARVSSSAFPDPSQYDPESKYFDPKASPEKPRWFCVNVTLVRPTELLELNTIRGISGLQNLVILQRGNRLSITPVEDHDARILEGLLL